jgi:hypothetical protein
MDIFFLGPRQTEFLFLGSAISPGTRF